MSSLSRDSCNLWCFIPECLLSQRLPLVQWCWRKLAFPFPFIFLLLFPFSFSCFLSQGRCQWYSCFLSPEHNEGNVNNGDLKFSMAGTESLYRKVRTEGYFHGSFLTCCTDYVATICWWSNMTPIYKHLAWKNKISNGFGVGDTFLNMTNTGIYCFHKS